MTNTVDVTIQLDRNLKSTAEQMLDGARLSLSTTITVFLKQTVIKECLPFDIETDPFWSEENQARFEQSKLATETGLLTEHELIEVD